MTIDAKQGTKRYNQRKENHHDTTHEEHDKERSRKIDGKNGL